MIDALVDGVPLLLKGLRYALLVAVGIAQILRRAVLIDPHREVGNMDGQWLIQVYLGISITLANKSFDVPHAVTLVTVKQLLRQRQGIAQPDAAMTEKPRGRIKERLVWRVVQIDRVLVGKQKLHGTQRIAVA